MTEAEAKTKWCPMVQYAAHNLPSNRDACYDMQGTHCIGSACMMWRTTLACDSQSDPHDPEVNFISGYCGLAGHP